MPECSWPVCSSSDSPSRPSLPSLAPRDLLIFTPLIPPRRGGKREGGRDAAGHAEMSGGGGGRGVISEPTACVCRDGGREWGRGGGVCGRRGCAMEGKVGPHLLMVTGQEYSQHSTAHTCSLLPPRRGGALLCHQRGRDRKSGKRQVEVGRDEKRQNGT